MGVVDIRPMKSFVSGSVSDVIDPITVLAASKIRRIDCAPWFVIPTAKTGPENVPSTSAGVGVLIAVFATMFGGDDVACPTAAALKMTPAAKSRPIAE